MGFCFALQKVGWLCAPEGGGISFPKFARHNGKSAKTRALTAKRVSKHKAKKRGTCAQQKGNAKSVTREEKNREEKKEADREADREADLLPVEVDLTTPDGSRAAMDVPEVHAAIREWLEYKIARSAKFKKEQYYLNPPLQMRKQVGRFSTPAEFVAAVDYTIANNWQGIQIPDDSKGPKNGKPDRKDSSIFTDEMRDNKTPIDEF